MSTNNLLEVYNTTIKRIRLTVEHWDKEFIYGYNKEITEDKPPLLRVKHHNNPSSKNILDWLNPGTNLNLLSVIIDDTQTLIPELFILEPDFLIDISTLAECHQNYGNHPLNYLVQKFKPREITQHILLGNVANQFLDDCVNEQPNQPACYEYSMQKIFRNDILAFSTCPHIDKEFFNQAHAQFNAIQETIRNLFKSPLCPSAQVEPSFLCEAMGLQGRMDFLETDFRNLIELKSGKAEGIGNNVRSKESHSLQMALYKEILFYSLDIPRKHVTSYLFYSRYPKLFAEQSTPTQIQEAIQVRNHIVANEIKCITDGGRKLLSSATAETLNLRHCRGKLWNEYQAPQLEAFFSAFRQASELTANYFFTFNAFVTREQYLSKTGNVKYNYNGGFSDTWNTDTATKLALGNILIDLRILEFKTTNEGIESVTFSIPNNEHNYLPNFRIGDIVMLYERNSEYDKATNHQIIRGSLEAITQNQLCIELRNKQRNPLIFNTESAYAIEHDMMDSAYSTLYKGLFSLLTVPEERRQLLLGERPPRIDLQETRIGNYTNEHINLIVQQAKQAKDYFLLIGPPGTGKTSVALRAMVEEFHLDKNKNILLLAYTNRAVDEICETLNRITPTPEYLRIGSELACEERFRPHLLKNLTKTYKKRTEVESFIQNIRIVVGTVSSISGRNELFQMKHFDVAIIDEASQILEPQIMGILCAHGNGHCYIDKFILIGDHKQLPAVVLQNTQDSIVHSELLRNIGITNCRNSLFERIYTYWQNKPSEGIIAMLDKQGRMHPDICAFVNQYFYDNKLNIVPLPHQQASLEWDLLPRNNPDKLLTLVATTRLSFIHTPSPLVDETNKANLYEARITAKLVKHIHQLCQINHLPFEPKKRIGIIVPFRNQISMISNELATLGIEDTEYITIDTVERFQGSQRDIIIYSTTISQLHQLENLSVITQTDGYTVDRKLNVAITRARKQLFILGNKELLQQHDIYFRLIQFIENHGTIVSL